jgi:hypothetical protein
MSTIEPSEAMAARLERELGSDSGDPLQVIRMRDAQIVAALSEALDDVDVGAILDALDPKRRRFA